MTAPLRIGVIGIDHRHIFTMTQHMLAAGGELVGWVTDGTPETLAGWLKRFPDAPRLGDPRDLIDDASVDIILTAAIPADRASIARQAMHAGKDVLSDKPGCLDLDQLAALERTMTETGRIWSVDFSERFEVPSVTRASDLVAAGAIGDVVHTLGIGPHRLNAPTRPDWFWDATRGGGILADIGSHQIDQFLHFTGSHDARVTHASAHCRTRPGFQDVGEMILQSDRATGYIKVDWFTPDAMPTWGDGRLFLTGTEGQIEIRKYADVGGATGGDHVFLTNHETSERMDASADDLPFFRRLTCDIRNRGEMAHMRAHPVTVTRLALQAQAMADTC